MQSVTQKLFKISLALCLSCHARVGIGQEEWTPERVLRLPTSDEAFDLSEFVQNLKTVPEQSRHEWVYEALAAGYMPSFLRQLKRVRSRHAGHELSFWVMPDYLSVGDNDNYLHVPVNGRDALALAQNWGMYLPTRKMVDLIYRQAGMLLPSVPVNMNEGADPIRLWLDHEERLEPELQRYAVRSGWIQAGHKKDLVMSPLLLKHPDRAAIYGWQGTDGQILQNLAPSVRRDYADYSMGVRFVAPFVLVDEQWMPLAEVLRNPKLAPLLSDEGPFDVDLFLKLDPLPPAPLRKTPASLIVHHRP